MVTAEEFMVRSEKVGHSLVYSGTALHAREQMSIPDAIKRSEESKIPVQLCVVLRVARGLASGLTISLSAAYPVAADDPFPSGYHFANSSATQPPKLPPNHYQWKRKNPKPSHEDSYDRITCHNTATRRFRTDTGKGHWTLGALVDGLRNLDLCAKYKLEFRQRRKKFGVITAMVNQRYVRLLI